MLKTPSINILSVVYAVSAGVLIALTWPLWMPQELFPRVPLFAWGLRIPPAFDGLFLSVAGIGLLVAFFPKTRAWGWTLFAAAIFLFAAVDQHRLQVWTYHIALAGLMIAGSSRSSAIVKLRWLTIGIYFWSAFSKVDLSFISHQGQGLWQGLLNALHLDANAIPAEAKRHAPWLFVMIEALTAVLLVFRRTRMTGLILSMAMHCGLMLTLGPWGLHHEAGVLVWNALFLIQNLVLFAFEGREPSETGPANAPFSVRRQLLETASYVAMAAALVLPALLPFGLWDIWPSWAVYSARGGWTTISVHEADAGNLSETVQPFVREPLPLSEWRVVDVDAWSLNVLNCPVYPQSRFRVALAGALAREARVRVELRSPPNRWTEQFNVETWTWKGDSLPGELARKFWLNTTAR